MYVYVSMSLIAYLSNFLLPHLYERSDFQLKIQVLVQSEKTNIMNDL